jgi:hypothetical protein
VKIDNYFPLPAFAECPVRVDGDECEKGIRRSSRLSKNLPACTKYFYEGRFGEQVSEGGCASAGFAEAVKMPRAEARGASLCAANSEKRQKWGWLFPFFYKMEGPRLRKAQGLDFVVRLGILRFGSSLKKLGHHLVIKLSGHWVIELLTSKEGSHF